MPAAHSIGRYPASLAPKPTLRAMLRGVHDSPVRSLIDTRDVRIIPDCTPHGIAAVRTRRTLVPCPSSTRSPSRRWPATWSGSRSACAAPCEADDRFLGDVAGHLLGAGGKRLRPMLTLCAGYAARGAARSGGDPTRRHRRRRGRARAPRIALPRRRDRRGRDPPRRAVGERALVEHRRDPRGRLPARAGVVARGVARRRRRGAARRDDRRAVPRPGARAAAPVRRRPHRGVVPLGDRRQDVVADGDRRAASAGWSATCRPTASTR